MVLTHQYSLTAWPVTQPPPLLCSPGVPAPTEATQTHPNPSEGGASCALFALFYSLSSYLLFFCGVTLLGEAGLSQRHLWVGWGRGKKGGEAVGSACFMRRCPSPAVRSPPSAWPCTHAQLPLLLGSLGLRGYVSPRGSDLSCRNSHLLGGEVVLGCRDSQYYQGNFHHLSLSKTGSWPIKMKWSGIFNCPPSPKILLPSSCPDPQYSHFSRHS